MLSELLINSHVRMHDCSCLYNNLTWCSGLVSACFYDPHLTKKPKSRNGEGVYKSCLSAQLTIFVSDSPSKSASLTFRSQTVPHAAHAVSAASIQRPMQAKILQILKSRENTQEVCSLAHLNLTQNVRRDSFQVHSMCVDQKRLSDCASYTSTPSASSSFEKCCSSCLGL